MNITGFCIPPRHARSGRLTRPVPVFASPLVLLALTLLLSASAPSARAAETESGDPRVLFRQANQAYAAAEYAQARDLYLRILAQAPGNPTVEYNLGNTYARLGDVARAVLHYERTLQTRPRFHDARQNLLRIAPPSNNPGVSPLIAPFRWIKQSLNVNEWLWVSFLLLFLLCVAGALWALEEKRVRVWKILTISLSILTLFTAAFSASSIAEAAASKGIVLHEKTLARSGPGDNYLEAMELPAGAKVIAAEEPQRGWVKIRTLEGNVAFVQTGDVEWI